MVSIDSAISKLGIENQVDFISPVRNSEMGLLLNSTDVYVSASLSDGTSVSLIEAMACGKPCIVTDLEANLEWIKNRENGLTFPKKDYYTLAKQLICLYKSKELIKHIKVNNVDITQKDCDWNKNGEKLLDLYERLTDVR